MGHRELTTTTTQGGTGAKGGILTGGHTGDTPTGRHTWGMDMTMAMAMAMAMTRSIATVMVLITQVITG